MFDRWKRYEAWMEYGPQPADPSLPELTPGNYPGKWLGFFWTERAARCAVDAETFAPDEPSPQRRVVARMPDEGVYFKEIVYEAPV